MCDLLCGVVVCCTCFTHCTHLFKTATNKCRINFKFLKRCLRRAEQTHARPSPSRHPSECSHVWAAVLFFWNLLSIFHVFSDVLSAMHECINKSWLCLKHMAMGNVVMHVCFICVQVRCAVYVNEGYGCCECWEHHFNFTRAFMGCYLAYFVICIYGLKCMLLSYINQLDHII